jgi:hypothetical protein
MRLMRNLAFVLVALGVISCGPPSQPQARDAATAKSCDWYARCDEIGAGKQYETRDACEIEVRNFWNNTWALADCDSKIDSEALDICLKSIEITQCGNGLDFLNTILNKCGKASVCAG